MVRAMAIALIVAACGSSPSELQRARATAAAALTPPAYGGVTRCGRPLPPDPPSPPGDLVGFATGAGVGDPDVAPRIDGALDPDVIRRPIVAHAAQFRACYTGLLVYEPDAAGRAVANFTVLGDGSVAAIAISGFDRRLDACICHEVERLQFPALGGGARAQVSYPFAFGM